MLLPDCMLSLSGIVEAMASVKTGVAFEISVSLFLLCDVSGQMRILL